MTATRRKLGRRDANEPEIIAALRAHGCSVVQIDHPADLLVARKTSITVLLEVKDPSKPPSQRRLTETEKEFHATWPGLLFVVETPEEALAAVGIEMGTSHGA